MKKSKIIGLSLGFTALAAVAISTPFIVTSCSSESNALTTNIKETFAQGKFAQDSANLATIQDSAFTADNFVGTKDNEVTIYTGVTTVNQTEQNNTFGSLTLPKTNATNIIGSDTVLKDTGFTADSAIKWELVSGEGWNLSTENVLSKTSTDNQATAISNNEVVTLKAEITEKDKTTKTLSIKITFVLGKKA